MILSHHNQFIFLKTRKTAGTSVEMALTNHCGHIDIVTPLALDDERKRMAKGQFPRNYFVVSPYREKRAKNFAEKEQLTKEDYKKVINNARTFHAFINHSTASEVASFTGPRVWDRYFKFTVERNPWDFQVSRFFWRKKVDPDFNIDFDQFLRLPHLTSNWEIYTIADRVAVDKVVLFEDLVNGLSSLKEQLGFDISDGLPHAKGNTDRKKQDYRDFYNDEQRKLVAKKFENVIDTFKYSF